jgi:formamidase
MSACGQTATYNLNYIPGLPGKGKTMNRLLGIGVCQLQSESGDTQKNMESLARQIEVMRNYSPWIKLVCAPELSLQGPYRMAASAQTIPGPITEFCSDLARKHGIYLIPGSLYEQAGELIYNTAPVFDPRGKMVARYRKMYPWRPYEKTASGSETVVFDITGSGRVGVCICYDLWFPEVIRDLVWKGAQVIVVPTFTGTQDRDQEIILCRAAAISNQCYVISINALGRGAKGQSLIVDPEGNVLQQAGQLPENLMAMLDLGQVDQIRKYGTCGVSRPVASFVHEAHRFPYQQAGARTPLVDTLESFNPIED